MNNTSRRPQPAIRRIRPEDGEAWREVRLRALLDAPDAFGSTHAETVALPHEEWTTRAARSSDGPCDALFLADDGRELVGLARGQRPPDQNEARHLHSMWVAPEFRGTRLAERLVDRLAGWAALAGASLLELWVTTSNKRAIRFYERLGFEATGHCQPVRPGSDREELEMAMELRSLREVH